MAREVALAPGPPASIEQARRFTGLAPCVSSSWRPSAAPSAQAPAISSTSARCLAFGLAFPWATLIVNVVGSFLMGAVVAASVAAARRLGRWRTFLATGILGGFTTFSAFSLDIFELVRPAPGACWPRSTSSPRWRCRSRPCSAAWQSSRRRSDERPASKPSSSPSAMPACASTAGSSSISRPSARATCRSCCAPGRSASTRKRVEANERLEAGQEIRVPKVVREPPTEAPSPRPSRRWACRRPTAPSSRA